MSPSTLAPVLIVGGSGVVGSLAARTLRRLHPDLPLTIGGRDLDRARAVADALGNADAARIDLQRPGLGLPRDRAHSALAMFVKDDGLRSLAYAQERGLPYLEISTAAFELAPLVAMYIHRPKSAPILLDGSWLASTTLLSTLYFAREFRTLDAIEISAVLDEQDLGGPAAYVDYERQTRNAASALMLVDGEWEWATGERAVRRFRSVDGIEREGQAYSLLDGLSLANATRARSIRFDSALGETASRRCGEPFSTEIIVELSGTLADGSAGKVRHELVHPQGQAPMTALGVALGVERLLGLAGGPPVEPGLHFPHRILEPETMVRRLAEFGVEFRRA